jgi:hypothetical protein
VTSTPDYFIAPFAPDGELIAVAGRSLSELSPQGLQFCRKLLEENGPVFHIFVPKPGLEHIRLQITSNSSATLVSFTIRGHAATSAVALRGTDTACEAEILRMFVDSMRRVPFVQQAAASAAPFEAAFRLAQRPLYIVVLWASPAISDGDLGRVQELENQLAGVLLGGPRPENPPMQRT